MKHRIPSTNWLWRAFIPMMLIVMFLIPKTVLAENALSWETYAQKVRIQEEAKGIYADWDIADKQDLIESLIQMNAMSGSAATRRLLEGDLSTESKHALADQIILRFLGGSSNALVRRMTPCSSRAMRGQMSTVWFRLWLEMRTVARCSSL